MHITLKSALRSTLYIYFVWLFNLSNLLGAGGFRIKNQSFDIDNDGKIENFTLNSSLSSISITEDEVDTLWSYNENSDLEFIDVELMDINGDSLLDIVAIPNLFTSIGAKEWLYVFLGSKKDDIFLNKPYKYNKAPFGEKSIKPMSLTLVSSSPPLLSVSFGSPLRYAVSFTIGFEKGQLLLEDFNKLSAPRIKNGYSPLYVEKIFHNNSTYIIMFSLENSNLNVAFFDIKKEFSLSYNESLAVGDVKSIVGSEIHRQAISSKSSDEGVIIPLFSGDSLFLYLDENEVKIKNKNLFEEKKISYKRSKVIENIEKARENLENEKIKNLVKEAFNPLANEDRKPKEVLYEKHQISEEENDITKVEEKFELKSARSKDYSSLSPTLGDFLESVKNTEKKEDNENKKISIPNVNSDMMSVNWADAAGFTKLDLGEYSKTETDTAGVDVNLPEIDSEIFSFTEDAKEAIKPRVFESDTLVLETSGNKIDLYYVLAMTPSKGERDRYIFNGEAPFGVSVNQIPRLGEATHFQHGISANLANLALGESFDFAYSLRDVTLDSITTLTMVHDMQTNVVFMSISPSEDSISQSYKPEYFDPKLFEFPDYFFEGFPNSLDMDFSEKLIRFSFDGIKDSLYQGIYLSSTTPSIPTQSLAVFMDQGKLQAIRGEVVVRPNGFKKIKTEFDLTGKVQPEVLFSRLIQEFFPDELKIKLLQGGSLEEPLFGPKGKIPKVFREPRLPEAQTEQSEPLIPIKPKQSNVPSEEVIKLEKVKTDSTNNMPPTQESDSSNIEFKSEVNNDSDTLKLENRKSILQEKKIENSKQFKDSVDNTDGKNLTKEEE